MSMDRRAFIKATGAALTVGVTGMTGTGGPGRAHPFRRVPEERGGVVGRRVVRPTPSPAQLLWQRDELALFVHFGINTFTDREWGDGTEDPAVFDPGALDPRRWARVARSAGFRAMILTAKHHDGFCLWPTRTTGHSVASSPWRGGQGDVVREFVDACRAEGLRAGLYCSPWDRNAPSYGDSPRYNDLYAAQLTELLTRYGPLHEVWFDGANGEGPDGRRQVYDWPRVWGLVRRHQPDAVIFSDAGPDIRWIGNETGEAGDPNWSTVDPGVVPEPGMWSEEVRASLRHGSPDGTVWRPGEADVSIRPGWFYHPGEDDRVRTPDDLVDLYFSSVGRNSKLLLNVPPMPDGLFHATDAAHLEALRRRLDARFAEDLAVAPSWRRTGPRTAVIETALEGPRRAGVIDLREDIEQGQIVERHTVEIEVDGVWRVVAEGTTIGYRRLHRVREPAIRGLRVRIQSLEAPRPVELHLFGE